MERSSSEEFFPGRIKGTPDPQRRDTGQQIFEGKYFDILKEQKALRLPYICCDDAITPLLIPAQPDLFFINPFSSGGCTGYPSGIFCGDPFQEQDSDKLAQSVWYQN